MDLENLHAHKRGTSVKVNGTAYEIDSKGVARGVKDADALKLLADRTSWRKVITRAPAPPAPPAQAPVSAPPSAPAESAPPPAPPEPVSAEQAPASAEASQPDAFAAVEEQEVPAIAPEDMPDAGEWPEPTEDMDMDYLKQMAKAYGINPAKRGKKQLVSMIKKAMYGDEQGS